MFTYKSVFSGFSVDDLKKAKEFYSTVLGVEGKETEQGLELQVKGSSPIFVYQKDTHVPATFTVLNFMVDDIDAAVDALAEAGVVFEQYQEGEMKTDEKGIARCGENAPDIAWFKDPAGNFLSVLQE